LRFSRSFSSRSEALSTQLAESLVRAARRFNLPVHPFDPVRSHVIRGGRAWVPAVLRFCGVPTAVLVEIVNLNNPEDRELLLSWQFREKLAHALAAGLAEGFAR
jgi:N-acetylmuramoyl-L-alanine amidase